MIDISILLQIIWTGLAASTYAVLFAVAFSLVLKVVKVWNFAQAGIMALSFYVMYAVHSKLGVPLLPSVGVGLVATIAANVFMDRYGLQTLRNRNSPTPDILISPRPGFLPATQRTNTKHRSH